MFSPNRLPHSTEAEIDLCQSLPSPNFQFANQQQQNSSSPSPISSSSASKNLHLFICFKNLQSLSFKTDFFHEDSQCEGSSPLHAKKTPQKKGGKRKREEKKRKKEPGTRDRLKRCVCSLEGSQIWKHHTAENACCSLSAVWWSCQWVCSSRHDKRCKQLLKRTAVSIANHMYIFFFCCCCCFSFSTCCLCTWLPLRLACCSIISITSKSDRFLLRLVTCVAAICDIVPTTVTNSQIFLFFFSSSDDYSIFSSSSSSFSSSSAYSLSTTTTTTTTKWTKILITVHEDFLNSFADPHFPQ